MFTSGISRIMISIGDHHPCVKPSYLPSLLKSLLVVGLIIVCVIAKDSDEDEDKKPNKLGILSPPARDALECKKNETSGCQPCLAEKTCQASPEDTVSSCKTECKVTCVCLNTHVRGPEGNCILQKECAKK